MKNAEPAIPAKDNIQDHYSLAVKERNWSLFLFFRILSNTEVETQLELEKAHFVPDDVHELVKADLAIIDPDKVGFDDLPERLGPDPVTGKLIDQLPLETSYFLRFLDRLTSDKDAGDAPEIVDIVSEVGLTVPLPADPLHTADDWFSQGLAGACAHEVWRYQWAPGTSRDYGLLRSKSDVKPSGSYSGSAVNIAFTHSGLAALKHVRNGGEFPVLDADMLTSFPDAFRKGMAARAKSLGDIGRSAPENWEGELGKSSIHGMLTAYFEVPTLDFQRWEKVRIEVEKFNRGDPSLRHTIRRLFRTFGLEVLHIELGQAPYDLPHGDNGQIKRPQIRREHFGFRDGISQPFVDLGLKTPLPGGGTPAKDGSWAPVAAGEIFLGHADEDGLTADQPNNTILREGGTYLVFRKLEQDVAGFRSYLEHQRSAPEARRRLVAQFVGRWPDGAPLVRHPDFDAAYIGEPATRALNDFRYRAEDPRGVKCPIAAHIRRTNPRDTGGHNEARYHRILRRSMSYGGPFLPEDVKGDGRPRGLLFIAANARIEMQFEVIQRDWINSSEFLGQVGAGRCPLTGANGGTPQDRFLEASAIAPISGIPSFVTMKGGDYFFVPSINALKAIATGTLGENAPSGVGKTSASLVETPALLTEEKIHVFGSAILRAPPAAPMPPRRAENDQGRLATHTLSPRPAVRIRLPREQNDRRQDETEVNFVLIGQHADVSRVLAGTPLAFSVAHYLEASHAITRGSALLLAMDEGGPLDAKRTLRLRIMNTAYGALKWDKPEFVNDVRTFIRGEVNRLVQRVAPSGRIDILQDLAFYISYRLVEDYIGVRGPSYLSELAVSLPYAKRHIFQLPPDWLKGLSASDVTAPGYTTMQIWSRLAFAEVIGNVLRKKELTLAAIQATSELLTYLDEQIGLELLRRRPNPDPGPKTFLEQLVAQRPDFTEVGDADYFGEVRTILADLVVTVSVNIGLPFSRAIQSALDFGFNLAWLVPALDEAATAAGGSPPQPKPFLEHFIYELLRLFPSAPAIYRRCEADTEFPSGAKFKRGDWVACLLPVAGQDPRAFPDNPNKFSIGTDLPAELRPYGRYVRDESKYLLFGPAGGVHRCWGEHFGKLVITELLRAAARFPGLTRVAGPAGQVFELPSRMDYSLKLKFDPIAPN